MTSSVAPAHASRADGVHNLDGPYGLSLLVWALARKQQLITLGVPAHLVTPTRKEAIGSSHPTRWSCSLLATGLWGCRSAVEIAHAIGCTEAKILGQVAHPMWRSVARPGMRCHQSDVAVQAMRGASSRTAAERVGLPTLDAHLLRRRLRWLLDEECIDLEAALSLPDDELAALWDAFGLEVRVTASDLDDARRVLSGADQRLRIERQRKAARRYGMPTVRLPSHSRPPPA